MGILCLLHPGNYLENITFKGKAITVIQLSSDRKTLLLMAGFLPILTMGVFVTFESGEKQRLGFKRIYYHERQRI